jgi:hypothetical protein
VPCQWDSKTPRYLSKYAALILHMIDEIDIGKLRMPRLKKVLAGDAEVPKLTEPPP